MTEVYPLDLHVYLKLASLTTCPARVRAEAVKIPEGRVSLKLWCSLFAHLPTFVYLLSRVLYTILATHSGSSHVPGTERFIRLLLT